MTKSPDNTIGAIGAHWADANVPEDYTVVCVGDIIMPHPILAQLKRKSPDLVQILANADLVVGNFEGTAIDLRKFDGYAEAQSGFSWLISTPDCAADLKALGFHMLARANNHTLDWGAKGMRMTDDLLIDAGLAIAGTGDSLSAARAPGYVNGDKARASFVSWSSTFEPNLPAIDAFGQTRSRPGTSTLGATNVVLVSPARLADFKTIRDAYPAAAATPQILRDVDERMGTVTLFGQSYKAHPAGTTDLDSVVRHYLPDTQDRDDILLNIRQAKQSADFTVAAAHTHEPSNWVETPPNYLPKLAEDAIANGADMVVGHGPHQLRGIQIINKRPVFYSLGNFVFMENARGVLPRDEWERRAWHLLENVPDLDPTKMTPAEFMEFQRARGLFPEQLWFESVIAITSYRSNGACKNIELVPIELHWKGRDAERGLPRLAAPADANRILARLQRLSMAQFETTITIDEQTGRGTIVVPL